MAVENLKILIRTRRQRQRLRRPSNIAVRAMCLAGHSLLNRGQRRTQERLALLRPHFCYLLFSQQDFGRSGRYASADANRFGPSPKPELWRGVQRAYLVSNPDV
jgi:hypothetical protein